MKCRGRSAVVQTRHRNSYTAAPTPLSQCSNARKPLENACQTQTGISSPHRFFIPTPLNTKADSSGILRSCGTQSSTFLLVASDCCGVNCVTLNDSQ